MKVLFIAFVLYFAIPYQCAAQDVEKKTKNKIIAFQNAINQLSKSSKIPNTKQIDAIKKQFFIQGSKIEDNITGSGNALSPEEYIGRFCLNQCNMELIPLGNTKLYESKNGTKIAQQKYICNIKAKNGTLNSTKILFELNFNKGIITRVASENSPLLSKGGEEIKYWEDSFPPAIAQNCDCTKDKNKICSTLGIKLKGKQTCQQAIKAALDANKLCPQCEQCPPPPPRPIINEDSIFSALCAQFIQQNSQLGIKQPPTNNRDSYETVIRNRIAELYEGTKINLDFKNAEKPLNQIVEQLADDFDLGKSDFKPNANNSSVTVNNKTSETLIEGLYGQVEDLNKKLDLARPVDIKVYFITNETAKKGKKEKIYFKEEGSDKKAVLDRAEYRKYKNKSVKTIYAEFPIQKELFIGNPNPIINVTNNNQSLNKAVTGSPLSISDIERNGLKFGKPTKANEAFDVTITIYLDNLNLIKNANSCPDKNAEKTCYKFIIDKGGNYETLKD